MRRPLSLVLTGVAVASVGGALAVLPAGAALAATQTPVTGLTAAAGEGQVSLAWTNPVPAPLHVVVREAVGTVPPPSVTSGTDVTPTTLTTAVVTGLAYATQYSFSVFTTDGTTPSLPMSVTTAALAATTMSIGVNPQAAPYGTRTVVSGRLRRGIDAVPVAGEKVTLYQRKSGATTWVGWAAAVTDSTGAVNFPVSFGRSTDFKLVHAPDAFYGGATSQTAPFKVNPAITISVPSLAKTFDNLNVSGTVKPALAGQTVYLQRYTTTWTTALATHTNAKGQFAFVLHPSVVVAYKLRVFLPAGSTHPSALSAKSDVTVGNRDLVTGDVGPDVLALQQRLAVLHYDTGAVNGSYSYDTFHAVTAFEKVQGLTRDGNVTGAVRAALAKPKTITLRYPVAGTEFEVDKVHQVVIMGVAGKVARILDSSTGFGGNYVYANVTYQAITPDGSYNIQRKIDGVRVSHLGVLYRPAYFFEGYAIHGEGLVPPYPASHGCVRITVPAMDRLYDLLTIGTPVHIFG